MWLRVFYCDITSANAIKLQRFVVKPNKCIQKQYETTNANIISVEWHNSPASKKARLLKFSYSWRIPS